MKKRFFEVPDWAEGAIILEGLDEAIIGIGNQWGRPPCLVYSIEKIIDILKKDMNADDAWEFYEHNIMCLGAGEQNPLMMEDFHGLE